MYKDKIKVTFIKGSDVDYFVNSLADKFFPYQGHGSVSAAVRYVIEYGLARETKDKMLTMSWVDLPSPRISQWDKVLHGLDTIHYTAYIPIESKDRLDYLAKTEVREENKIGDKVKVKRYPKFHGFRRNVIIQCVKVLIGDMAEMALKGETIETLKDVENFFGVVVKREED